MRKRWILGRGRSERQAGSQIRLHGAHDRMTPRKKIVDKREEQEKNVRDLIRSLVKARFYGELVVKFEDGHALVGKKTETVKF